MLGAMQVCRGVSGGKVPDITIRPYEENDLVAVVELSLRAWAPVFASIQQAMAPEIYTAFYPKGWEASQREAVTSACMDPQKRVWLADRNGVPVGFVAVAFHATSSMGEIHMLAVDPDYQRDGIGTVLTKHAIDWLRSAGMSIVMVETGGDPGHAPARRTYERAGFKIFPVARYFMKL